MFHGPALQGLTDVAGASTQGLLAHCKTSSVGDGSVLDLLALDCGLQSVILWCHLTRQTLSLPARIGRYRQYQSEFGSQSLRIEVRAREASGSRILTDVTWLDAQGQIVATLEDYESTEHGQLQQAFGRNRLPSSQSTAPGRIRGA